MIDSVAKEDDVPRPMFLTNYDYKRYECGDCYYGGSNNNPKLQLLCEDKPLTWLDLQKKYGCVPRGSFGIETEELRRRSSQRPDHWTDDMAHEDIYGHVDSKKYYYEPVTLADVAVRRNDLPMIATRIGCKGHGKELLGPFGK